MPKLHPDLFGYALRQYMDGDQKGVLKILSPEFEEDKVPLRYYFRAYQDMPELEKTALDLCKGVVLDAGAGAGSHALYLQSRGFDVTGLDSSLGACEIMKARGLKKVVRDDIEDTTLKGFDTILMMMNGIGITSTVAGLKHFLQKLPSMLNPGGQCIFDSTNLIYLYKERDGSVYLNLNDSYYGEIEFQMEYKGFVSQPFTWLYADFDTLDWMADDYGLSAEILAEGKNYSFLARLTV